jgi:integrase
MNYMNQALSHATIPPEPKTGGIVMAQNAKVYQRGQWAYVQLYWKGEQWRRSYYDERVRHMDRSVADRLCAAINADLDRRGKAFDPRQWFPVVSYRFQFSVYASEWLGRNTSRYAPSTNRDVSRCVQLAIECFGKTDIREIRMGEIEDWAKALPASWSPKTRKNALGILHKVFADAYRREDIPRVPGFPTVEVAEPEVKWIEREVQDAIIGKIPEEDRPIFLFMQTYGCRPGEARALQWDCVDFDKDIVAIRRTFSGCGTNHLQEYTKTRRVRYFPITDNIRDSLLPIRGIGGFVYRNTSGRPYTADLSRIWNEAQAAAEIPKKRRVTLYQGTRHSFATQHLDQLDLVRIILGHTQVSMTKKYEGINVGKLKKILC